MNKVIKIEGLDCANCARELEEELNKLDGVSATVDFMAQKFHVDCDFLYEGLGNRHFHQQH